MASTLGDTSVVSSLLELGADVSRGDSHGLIALQWADIKGHSDIADLLKNHQEYTGKPTTIIFGKIFKVSHNFAYLCALFPLIEQSPIYYSIIGYHGKHTVSEI